MPRTEQPLPEGDSILIKFAAELRKLRRAAALTYRELGRHTHYSSTTLADAAGGKKLPSLPVTLAYVRACGGNVTQWEQDWHATAGELAAEATRSDVVLDFETGDDRPPYAGLAAFQADDAARFFGRESLVDELEHRVTEQRFVAVFGASGAGKSSLLRAGLIARLVGSRTSNRWVSQVVLLTPGAHPIEECAIRLAALAGESAVSLNAEFAADPANLHLRVRQILAERGEDTDLVLVVDQFEEVFTLCRDNEERARFIDGLVAAATTSTSRPRIMLGV